MTLRHKTRLGAFLLENQRDANYLNYQWARKLFRKGKENTVRCISQNTWTAWEAGALVQYKGTQTEGDLKNVTIWTPEMGKNVSQPVPASAGVAEPWGSVRLETITVSAAGLWHHPLISSRHIVRGIAHMTRTARTHTHQNHKIHEIYFLGGKLAMKEREAGEFWQPWAEGLHNSQMAWWTAGHSRGTQWMRHKLCQGCFYEQ